MEPNEITANLSEIDAKAKPVKPSASYVLSDPETLTKELFNAIDTGKEETFSTEATVTSYDPQGKGEPDIEIFKVSFRTHASWGLMGKVIHPTEGTFRFYLEFLRDA